MKTLALEKLKVNAEQVQTTGEAESMDEMLSLINHMHGHLIMMKKSQSCKRNNVKLIDSMKFENLSQSFHCRCRESEEDGKFSFLLHLQEHEQTSPGSTLRGRNHLHSPSLDITYALPENDEKLDSGRLRITSSAEFHYLSKNNGDSVSEHLVSPSRTDLPDVTSDKASQIHDLILSNPSANPNLTQTMSEGTPNPSPALSVESTGLTLDTSKKVKSDPPVVEGATIPQVESEFLIKLSAERPQSDIILQQSERELFTEIVSSVIEPRSDFDGVEAGVQKLVEDLQSSSLETLRAAIAKLRYLAKLNTENRIMISECGAISLLIKLLYSTDTIIQEQAVTTLLNLSIHSDCKVSIGQANAVEPLIHVIETGSSEAKENTAAALFSLSMIEENRIKIGRSGAIGPLVEMLGNGTPRGRKDAATALFYLSLLQENKVKIVQAGAVKHLVDLMDPSIGMVDKAVAVLANLSSIPEGRVAIGREGGIPVLVEAVELGSPRGKENAAAALLRLCSNANKYCIMALQEGVIPPLVALSQSGTRRAKEKARKLLDCFKNHVHSSVEKG